MNLRDGLEVEPLGEARLSRIKRNVFDRLDTDPFAGEAATPTVRSWFGQDRVVRALVAFAVFGAIVGVYFSASPRAVPTGANPSRIVTGSAPSHVMVGDNAVDVAPSSVLLASGNDEQGILLVLERGTVTCDVTPRLARPPFVVQAGSVRVRVVGTRFTVRREDDSARVEVTRGTVEVSAGADTIWVHPGEAWPKDTRSTKDLGPTPPPENAAPLRTIEATDRPLAAPGARLAPLRPTGVTRFRDRQPEPSANPPPSPPPASEPSEQDLFEQAASHEKRDPNRAMALYEPLAERSGPWAANALFAQGRLASDLGHLVEARHLLEVYLMRYPLGRNADDARTLLDRQR
jgi:ferric-dicitrate binding protein FerR (iron transport regulator)